MTVSVHIYVQCVSSPSPPCLSMVSLDMLDTVRATIRHVRVQISPTKKACKLLNIVVFQGS